MRTTLVIPDPVYRRAKEAARRQGRTLSNLVTESIEIQLARQDAPGKKQHYKIQPATMGAPRVDPGDRESLYRTMEE